MTTIIRAALSCALALACLPGPVHAQQADGTTSKSAGTEGQDKPEVVPPVTVVQTSPKPKRTPVKHSAPKMPPVRREAATVQPEGGKGGGTASNQSQKNASDADAAGGANGFLVQDASVGTMTQTPLMQTPMTVEVIPQRILQEQGITSTGLSNALAYVGVQTSGFGTQGETLTFRGFTTSTTLWNGFRIEEVTPTYIGGIGGVWMDNVQRLEVLKGPSSILYGQAEPGGTVNVLTKKPQKTAYAAVDAGTGSWDQYRVGADVTGALSAENRA